MQVMSTEHSGIIALLGSFPSKLTLPPQSKMAKWLLVVPEHFLALCVRLRGKGFYAALLLLLAPHPQRCRVY